MPERKKMSKRQAGQLGGLIAAHKLGPAGLRRRGRKGGDATLAKYGRAHYVKMALRRQGYRIKDLD